MNITKAIRLNRELLQSELTGILSDEREAIMLGIEALKAIRATREPHSRILPSYLPGETEN